MEEKKLLRKKSKALDGSNRRALANACNDLATYYYKLNRYEEALKEYQNEAIIFKELNLHLEWGTCNRMIGETYLMMSEFDKALKHEERHLNVAKELKNSVEEQRAYATLGRIYLLQGQSANNNKEAIVPLKSAVKAFVQSLRLCENLNGKINKHELMDMRARLFLNIGVVQEHLGDLARAVDYIHKAIAICLSQDLFEVLHNCYTTEAILHSNKNEDYAKALGCLNKALEVASRLEDKVNKTCETLASKADILCKMSDYNSAKQVLHKAWKLQSPDETERENIESNLKVVAAMCYTQDTINLTSTSNYDALKKLYEKLGDGACFLKNYSGAVEYYLKALENAELAGLAGKEITPLYVSLYQTYEDMKLYSEALHYYEKEYDIIKENPKEAYTTLYEIARMSFLSKKPYHNVEKACLEARKAAQEWNQKKYEIKALEALLEYQQEYGETEKIDATKSELAALGTCEMENSEDEQGGVDDAICIGDDICLEDLTDLSDTNEEDAVKTKKDTRKRGKSFSIKRNIKGETQLHVAAISGNKTLAERLLANGHPVNVRDYAGWQPLHEACINGRLELASILIDNGANVNDRGGPSCDGITPLHDAACNGHLEIVQLLLRRGAIPSLKTDLGRTALQELQKWRAANVLTKEEETLYNNICNEMHSSPVNADIIITPAKTVTPMKADDEVSVPSTSKKRSRTKTTPASRRHIIDDDTDEELDVPQHVRQRLTFQSDDSNDSDSYITKNKCLAEVKEYRQTISALRNRNIPTVEVENRVKKSAILDSEEVDDDWLIDDTGVGKARKRIPCDPLEKVAKKAKLNGTNVTKPLGDSNKFAKQKSKISEIIDLNENSSHNDQYHSDENVFPEVTLGNSRRNSIADDLKSKDSRDAMRRRWKCQSTLLKAGFERTKSDNSLYNTSINNRVENFGINTNVVHIPHNPPTLSGIDNRGLHIVTPIAVKVQVEDKVLLIPLKLDTINKLTISWLVDEIKSRYYKLTGVKPVFSLMTSDGAILSEEDPLSLVLGSLELKTCITHWKASPAEERYLECCDALNIPPCEEIQQAIGRSHTTRRLALGVQTLTSSQIRPLFRALTHQTHITAIMIADNNIGDDGFKYLTECLSTLKHITHLDISKNNITQEGTKLLLQVFERATRPVCQSLEELDLSNNQISDVGFNHIRKLSHRLRLKMLKLNNCNITEHCLTDASGLNLNLELLESIDLSNNSVKRPVVSYLMTSLNPNIIVDLELDDVGAEGDVVGNISSFMDSAKELKIRRLGLSNYKLTDGQFMRIFRSLRSAKHLQCITLKNNNLTFITLKKLLQRQPPVPQVNLEGCQDIFKYSPDSDFHVWLPAIDFGRCIPEINVTPVSKTDEERESLKSFSKTWLSCFKGRGIIEHGEGGTIKFTAK